MNTRNGVIGDVEIVSDSNRPLVSILTPTWNRAAYLERVWKGLESQTYNHIEWIVCDDGSTDDTQQVLADLRAKSKFPITVIKASIHVGKARMDNEGIARARGEFLLWNDSDDYLKVHAIERLVKTWNSIPENDRVDFVGVTALCATDEGVISSKLPKSGVFDVTWNDLRERCDVAGDMLYCVRSSRLKAHPFLEVDLVVPEGSVWTLLGNAKTRVCPEVLKVVEYNAPNCISFSGKMEYCRGRAYALAIHARNITEYPKPWKVRALRLLTFIRCSIHGEIGLRKALRLWGENSPTTMFVAIYPIATLLVVKDILQGKVVKTHREFESAMETAVITVTDEK